jgi:lipopolysaccharide transport system ATP-binding protein
MSNFAIRVENLSKLYRIGQLDTHKTLRDVLSNTAKRPVQMVQSWIKGNGVPKPTNNTIWALKDVSFEVKKGEVLGIIGRNGAGKTTLLKILSRVTEPTRGRVEGYGRVGSLLEVGTGFHPELTGRENIYFNGAILGMSKAEIQRKFDEIVAFSEVEKFLDTPVKRYSSGMHVRLAFAVAAHLDPEILIVDEVLAVGDVNFQKKCLGKMQSVSQSQGRTVLFVSHNRQSIQRLCSQCMLLERGQLIDYGDTARVIAGYLASNSHQALPNAWIDLSQANRLGTRKAYFAAVQYSSLEKNANFLAYSNGALEFLLAIESDKSRSIGSLSVVIFDQTGNKLVNTDTRSIGRIIELQKGQNLVKLRIKQLYLNPGIYVLGFWLADTLEYEVFDYIESAFEIEVVDFETKEFGQKPGDDGTVTCQFDLLPVA